MLHDPTLTLFEQFHSGGDFAEQARERIILHHWHLVGGTVYRMKAIPHYLRDDAESAGTLGLIRSVDCFDPSKGFKFTTYAIATIKGAVRDFLRNDAWVRRDGWERYRAGGPEPPRLVPLDAPQFDVFGFREGDRPLSFMEKMTAPDDPEKAALANIEVERFWDWVQRKGGANAWALAAHYGDGQMQEDLARRMGVSGTAVWRRVHDTLDRLGADLDSDPEVGTVLALLGSATGEYVSRERPD